MRITCVMSGATADTKSLIFNNAWWMKKQGDAPPTIGSRVKLSRILAKRGADLRDPETAEATIAGQNWSDGRKENAVDAYTSLLKMTGGNLGPAAISPRRAITLDPD